jgi:hypothetical protein
MPVYTDENFLYKVLGPLTITGSPRLISVNEFLECAFFSAKEGANHRAILKASKLFPDCRAGGRTRRPQSDVRHS